MKHVFVIKSRREQKNDRGKVKVYGKTEKKESAESRKAFSALQAV